MSFTRKTIRGSASALNSELNRLSADGWLHEVWTLGVTNNPEDIELGLELHRVPTPNNTNMLWEVISGSSYAITAREEQLRQQKKYIATAHRQPIHGDKERAVAVIQYAK